MQPSHEAFIRAFFRRHVVTVNGIIPYRFEVVIRKDWALHRGISYAADEPTNRDAELLALYADPDNPAGLPNVAVYGVRAIPTVDPLDVIIDYALLSGMRVVRSGLGRRTSSWGLLEGGRAGVAITSCVGAAVWGERVLLARGICHTDDYPRFRFALSTAVRSLAFADAPAVVPLEGWGEVEARGGIVVSIPESWSYRVGGDAAGGTWAVDCVRDENAGPAAGWIRVVGLGSDDDRYATVRAGVIDLLRDAGHEVSRTGAVRPATDPAGGRSRFEWLECRGSETTLWLLIGLVHGSAGITAVSLLSPAREASDMTFSINRAVLLTMVAKLCEQTEGRMPIIPSPMTSH